MVFASESACNLERIFVICTVGQTEHPELLQRLKELDQAFHNPEAVQHMSRNPQVEGCTQRMHANLL